MWRRRLPTALALTALLAGSSLSSAQQGPPPPSVADLLDSPAARRLARTSRFDSSATYCGAGQDTLGEAAASLLALMSQRGGKPALVELSRSATPEGRLYAIAGLLVLEPELGYLRLAAQPPQRVVRLASGGSERLGRLTRQVEGLARGLHEQLLPPEDARPTSVKHVLALLPHDSAGLELADTWQLRQAANRDLGTWVAALERVLREGDPARVLVALRFLARDAELFLARHVPRLTRAAEPYLAADELDVRLEAARLLAEFGLRPRPELAARGLAKLDATALPDEDLIRLANPTGVRPALALEITQVLVACLAHPDLLDSTRDELFEALADLPRTAARARASALEAVVPHCTGASPPSAALVALAALAPPAKLGPALAALGRPQPRELGDDGPGLHERLLARLVARGSALAELDPALADLEQRAEEPLLGQLALCRWRVSKTTGPDLMRRLVRGWLAETERLRRLGPGPTTGDLLRLDLQIHQALTSGPELEAQALALVTDPELGDAVLLALSQLPPDPARLETLQRRLATEQLDPPAALALAAATGRADPAAELALRTLDRDPSQLTRADVDAVSMLRELSHDLTQLPPKVRSRLIERLEQLDIRAPAPSPSPGPRLRADHVRGILERLGAQSPCEPLDLQLLLRAETFSPLWRAQGRIPQPALAMWRLMRRPDRRRLLLRLLERGSPAGQVYALHGLFEIDRRRFERYAASLRGDATPVTELKDGRPAEVTVQELVGRLERRRYPAVGSRFDALPQSDLRGRGAWGRQRPTVAELEQAWRSPDSDPVAVAHDLFALDEGVHLGLSVWRPETARQKQIVIELARLLGPSHSGHFLTHLEPALAFLGGVVAGDSPDLARDALQVLADFGAWSVGARAQLIGRLESLPPTPTPPQLALARAMFGVLDAQLTGDPRDLLALTRHPASDVRYRAVRLFGQSSPGGAARARIQALARDPAARVRGGVAFVLGSWPPAASDLPVLVELLDDSDPRPALTAAASLVEYGAAATAPLRRALKRTSAPRVRLACSYALWKLSADAGPLPELLIAELARREGAASEVTLEPEDGGAADPHLDVEPGDWLHELLTREPQRIPWLRRYLPGRDATQALGEWEPHAALRAIERLGARAAPLKSDLEAVLWADDVDFSVIAAARRVLSVLED